MTAHDHDLDPSCPETIVNGEVLGACMTGPSVNKLTPEHRPECWCYGTGWRQDLGVQCNLPQLTNNEHDYVTSRPRRTPMASDLTPERRELLRKARIVHVSREWGTALLTEFADHILLLEDALAAAKAAREEAERENADLLSPERDATGLTYGDRRAWDDLCQRWKEAEACAVKAEQDRDEWRRVAAEQTRMERDRALAAEAAYAALVARINALADKWTFPGRKAWDDLLRDLRALTEKDALCIECGDHRGWTVQPDWNTGDAVQTQCRACSEHECPTPSAVTEKPTDD